MNISDQDCFLSTFATDQSPVSILWVDANADIHLCNRAMQQLLNVSSDELIGKKLYHLFAGQNETHFDNFWPKLQQAEEIHQESVIITTDGKKINAEISAYLVTIDGKEFACIFIQDISSREQTQQELQAAFFEIEQLKTQLEQEVHYLRQEIKLIHNFQDIFTINDNFKRILGKIEQVASINSTVLIQGETGTGKELIARAIHNISPRASKPMIKVNCAALPASIIESELFGHEKGAFTGAYAKKIGRFELANTSSIFLDEIGELPLELQAKLLQVLQEGEFNRLGGNKTIHVDARVIVATNRDLESAIEDGSFRRDLYYRLNVFPIKLPPLRDRKDDIPVLVEHFIDKYNKKIGKSVDKIPKHAMDKLLSYDWPGNVRELEHVIEHAIILCQGSNLDLGDWLPQKKMLFDPAFVTMQEMEKAYILRVLQSTNWRVSGEKGAAQILGMKRTTLESKMRKFGITRHTPI